MSLSECEKIVYHKSKEGVNTFKKRCRENIRCKVTHDILSCI